MDVRLYLPQKWTDEPERCRKAGLSEPERVFRSKDELALEIVSHSRKNGLSYGWVGADGGYGKGPGFCLALDRMGEPFVVDLHSIFRVNREDFQPYIPENTCRRGRKFTRYRSDAQGVEVKEIVERLGLSDQPVIDLQDTTRGPLKMRDLRHPVYVWDGESPEAHRFYLLATRTLGRKPETKISLSNATEAIDFVTLAWMQLQRYWVEGAFEDGKSDCGMSDYQVRKWCAWHHHMAMLFMLSERIRHQEIYPFLSCSDIENLLSRYLPRRDLTEEEVLRQLELRHRKRLAAMQSHSRSSQRKANQQDGPS